MQNHEKHQSGKQDSCARWLERRELLIREGDRFRNACSRDAPPGWHTPANVVRYLDNNLEDLVPDVARVLPC